MSPVNSGESSGEEFSDSGRQLTRKEIRAREKFLATEGHDVVPPQAFETGHSPQFRSGAAGPTGVTGPQSGRVGIGKACGRAEIQAGDRQENEAFPA